jgi:hypothetical protein
MWALRLVRDERDAEHDERRRQHESENAEPPMRPAAGSVRIQAMTMFPATPHRTQTGGLHRAIVAGRFVYPDRARRAMRYPASQPGARPCVGGRMCSGAKSARASSQEITEFEFHISPV